MGGDFYCEQKSLRLDKNPLDSLTTLHTYIFVDHKNSKMPKQKSYHVDCCAEKAVKLLVSCKLDPDPSIRLKVPTAMLAKGNSMEEATNPMLQQQVG